MSARSGKLINILRTAQFVAILSVLMLIMSVGQFMMYISFELFGTTDEKKLRFHRTISETCKWLLYHTPGARVKLINNAGETFEEPAVIVCNHQSHLDLLCIMSLTPKMIIMAKKWVWRNPLYCVAIKYADFLSTEDTFEVNDAKIEAAKEKGYSTVIFPEGTRSATLKLGRFHRGAFHVAIKKDMDVLPIVVHGTGKVLNKKSFALTPGDITIEILERVPAGATHDHTELCKIVRNRILENYNRLETGEQEPRTNAES